jgi:hypothetical protein
MRRNNVNKAMTCPTKKLEEIYDLIQKMLYDLEFEARQVYEQLVKPNWNSYSRRYYSTLYGYMMRCFSFIDLLSAYQFGKDSDQTNRMKRFMTQFLKYDEQSSYLAIHFWRHKLMHTAQPRRLIGKKTKKKYSWLLHWGNELPRNQHMKFQDAEDPKILNVALFYLIEDLENSLDNFFEYVNPNNFLKYENYLENIEINE